MKIEIVKVGMLQTNCYILIGKKNIIIIDPGGDANKIADVVNEYLDENTKIQIVNTHYHYDHTLANDDLRQIFDLEVLIHEYEKNFIEFKADKFLTQGDKIKVNDTIFEIMHTPGHTKGGIILLGEDVAFVGDTIFEQGIGRTDFPGGSMEEMEKSLEKLPNILKPGMTIYPGHGNKFIWNG